MIAEMPLGHEPSTEPRKRRARYSQPLEAFLSPLLYCAPSALNTASAGLERNPVWNFANSSPGIVGIAPTLAIGSSRPFAPASAAICSPPHSLRHR